MSTGTYELKASWLGDENTLPAESSIITVTVLLLHQASYSELLSTIKDLQENITKAQNAIKSLETELSNAQDSIQALQGELSRGVALQYGLITAVIIQALSIILFALKRKTTSSKTS